MSDPAKKLERVKREFAEGLEDLRGMAATLPRGDCERELLVKWAKGMEDTNRLLAENPQERKAFLQWFQENDIGALLLKTQEAFIRFGTGQPGAKEELDALQLQWQRLHEQED